VRRRNVNTDRWFNRENVDSTRKFYLLTIYQSRNTLSHASANQYAFETTILLFHALASPVTKISTDSLLP